jgi:ABC-type nickel/cobalt efflux system permease component RcnA
MQKMKAMKLNAKLLIIGLAIAFTAMACGNASESKDAKEKETEKTEVQEQQKPQKAEDKTGPEYTSRYICPMHCEGSGSSEPGICPVCGMDYVLNEDFEKGDTTEEGHHHDHGHDHSGHDHHDEG